MRTRTLAQIAELCGAVLDGDPGRLVDGPAALSEAGPSHVSFLANPLYAPELESTRAGAVLVARGVKRSRADLALLVCDDPNRAFTAVVQAFAPPAEPFEAGVHPSAYVHPDARVDRTASVGAQCAVGRGATIAAGARLLPTCVVGAEGKVGEHSVLHPAVVLYARVEVGARCVVHAGAVLGSDGFGFEPTPKGWVKIPQCGTVVIEDDVEIGANCTIDRARFGVTRIGRGVKIDNLVHLGHNVIVEPGALIIAQAGVSGSARIGAGAILAGQVGVGGHVTIGARARIGAQAGVTKDVAPGAELWGTPARPKSETLRSAAWVGRLPDLADRLQELERRLDRLLEGRVEEKPFVEEK